MNGRGRRSGDAQNVLPKEQKPSAQSALKKLSKGCGRSFDQAGVSEDKLEIGGKRCSRTRSSRSNRQILIEEELQKSGPKTAEKGGTGQEVLHKRADSERGKVNKVRVRVQEMAHNWHKKSQQGRKEFNKRADVKPVKAAKSTSNAA